MRRQAVALACVFSCVLSACAPQEPAAYKVAKDAATAALSGKSGIEFSDMYESTPDLTGISQIPNYKPTFVCGRVGYTDGEGKRVNVRFIYRSSSNVALPEVDPLILDRPELNYGLPEAVVDGRYPTVFEFSGWNRLCANKDHPATFTGSPPASDG